MLFSLNGALSAMEKNIASLPTEIKTQEIVKQIINSSISRDEALSTISNYSKVDTDLYRYIKNNTVALRQLLDQKFGLSLTTLASGEYGNPHIKQETLVILQNEYQKSGKRLGVKVMLDGLVDLVNGKTNTRSFNQLNNIFEGLSEFFENVITTKNYGFLAVILGALKNLNQFFNFNTVLNKTEYANILNFYASQFKNNKSINAIEKQILILLVATGKQLFGKNFLLENLKTTTFTGSVIDYVKKINNSQLISLLESI
jgi:hypothetical protein